MADSAAAVNAAHWACRALRLGFLVAAAVAAPDTAAQTPDPLAEAAPCREATKAALQGVNGATAGAAYADLLEGLQRAIEGFTNVRADDDESSLHCLNAYGQALLRLGEHALGAGVYRRAHEVALKAYGPADDSTLTLQGNLAVALTSLNRNDEAANLHEQVLAARESLAGTPSAHKLAITLMNLAMVRSARGELQAARSHAERAWTLSQSMPASDRRSGTMAHNYALVLDRIGSRVEAQRLMQLALRSRLEAGEAWLAIESLASLAASYFDVGRFEESDRRYREALALSGMALPPLHPLRAELLRSWCRVLSVVGKPNEALARCDDAIRLFAQRRSDAQLDSDRTLVNRGLALSALGRAPEAINSLRDAVRGLTGHVPEHHPELLEAKRALSVVLVDQGQLDEGTQLLESVLAAQTADLPSDHPERVLTLGEYGVLLAIRGQLADAEKVLKDYAAKTERSRADYLHDQRTSMGVFRRFASTRMFLAKLMVIKSRCAEAFDWIEQTKARALFDRITMRAAADAAGVSVVEALSALEQARARLYVERALSAGDGAKQSDIDVRLSTIGNDIAALTPAATTAAAQAGARPSADLSAARLPANSAALSIGLVDDEVLLVLYQSSRGFSCTSLGNWTGLSDTVQAVRALQSTPGGMPALMAGSARQAPRRIVRRGERWFTVLPRSAVVPANATPVAAAEELEATIGRELLGWILERTKGTRSLYVSSDGVLNTLALDALRVDGQRVLDRLSLLHVPTFKRFSARPRQRAFSEKMIVIGDPVYAAQAPTDDERHVTSTRARQLLRGDLVQGERWPPLPAAALEVRGLTKAFELKAGTSVFARQDATVNTLRRVNASGVLERTRFLVLVAHGMADLEEPELSSLVFSRPPGANARDAYFTAAELSTLRLGTGLVYFSACDTGYGQVLAGEGVLGLAAGALAAGSLSTIHTLWSIDDAASAEFTVQFFNKVKSGVSTEQALRATKRAFSTRSGPALWAPYVLMTRFGE